MTNDIKNNWVYQSNKLIESIYQLTPLEHKILRILISMIRRDDVDFVEYRFDAREINKFLGINPKNVYTELDKATDRLMTRFVKVKDDEKEKFKKRHLIDIADYEEGVLTLKIHEDMKPFYLKLQEYFTKYQLKNILKFKSTYSFRFYELLKQYETIGYRIMSVEELRNILDIQENKYPKYANLKQKVILIAIKEINTYTDIFIDFEELKKGTKVDRLKFNIKSNIEKLKVQDEVAVTVEEIRIKEKENSLIEQVKKLLGITDKEAEKLLKVSNNDLDLIKRKYDLAKEQGNIKNLVAWLYKAILENYQEPKQVNNNFISQYDMKELKKALLGR